ncbi:MAG: serine/threonine protein kinase [Opitutae bacterium]|jgi:serine/threonine protein kinase|nr:serine/threonine protein kinase [Opitutae bacterium]
MESLSKGFVINDTYTIKTRVGSGAFGEVYRAEHKHLGNQVLKLLKAEIVNKQIFAGVISEARILASLSHPNVVRVFEANSFHDGEEERYYLTMEFISGESLSSLIERKSPLDLDFALEIQMDYLSGLSYAHDRNSPIVHRDVNDDNIILSYSKGNTKALLADFGLAAISDEVSWSNSSAGRYAFMAPECFFGSYLPSSDVFSAGMVLYRMLTGIYPWRYSYSTCNSYADVSNQVLACRNNVVSKPSTYNSNVSEQLDEIVMLSLEKDLSKRFRNAGEFLEALKPITLKNNLTENE